VREIFSARNLSQAEVLCGLLREQGIDAEIGSDPVVEAYALGARVPVLVPDAQEATAGRILTESTLAGDTVESDVQVPLAADDSEVVLVAPERTGLLAECFGVLFVLAGWSYVSGLLQPLVGFPDVTWSPLAYTVNAALSMFQVLVLLWLVRRWRHEPAATFGLVRPRWSDLGLGLLALAGALFATILHAWWTGAQWEPPSNWPQLGATFGLATCVLLGIVFDAVNEEALWRGYALTRVQQATGSPVFAVLVSSLLFALVHLYQGPLGVFSAGLMGLVWGLMFARVRRIAPTVIGHAAINVVITGW
jgi:membrane protease YdiL (CAAX protease family)